MGKGRRAALLIAAWLLAFDVTAAWTPETVKAGETTELTDGTYNYTVNADGTTATLTKYVGSEADVVIPETIGDGLTVTTLGGLIFSDNTSIKTIYIPKTIVSLGAFCREFIGATSLETITVDKENPVLYDEDGVLFAHLERGNHLVKYPEGKTDEFYKIPQDIYSIEDGAFNQIKSLKTLVIPDTVQWLFTMTFTKMSANIIINDTHPDELEIGTYAFNYLTDSKIIVRNAAMAEAVSSKMRNCTNTTVINLAGLSEEEQKAYLVPATSLTWDGTNTIGKTTLSPGEKCQLSCQQLPSNTTDNVVWSSSDPAVAKVDATTGLIEASGGVNYTLKTGTTTITGTDESGHSITLEVTVYKKVESVKAWLNYYEADCPWNSEYKEAPTGLSVSTSERATHVLLYGIDVSPVNANNAGNIEFSSSNEKVATIEEREQDSACVKIASPGTTTITATLNDNGTIFTKSFVLTVTDAANAGDGTDNNSGNNAGNGGTTPGNDSSKDNDGNAGGTISTPPTYTQPIKTSIEKGRITPTTITLTYGTNAKIRVAAKGRTTCSVTNKKIAALTSSGKLVPKNTGVTTLKVKADASGKYKGRTITYRLIVLPKKETVTYAKSLKAEQLMLKWKKDTKATGYQIQYSTSSKFTKKTTKTITIKKNKTSSRTIKKLSCGKKYYVRVRAYKTTKINGKKTNKYGAWSRRKAVAIS